MNMNAKALFEQIRLLWPELIALNSFQKMDDRSILIPVIRDLYEGLEHRFENDEWTSLGIWAFHQALWARAVEKINRNETYMKATDVTFSDFDHQMRANLSDPSWSELRDRYL